MRRRNELRGVVAFALAGLFAVAACSGDETGPPRVGCPSGVCGPAPLCGQACKSACGCCPCVDGTTDDRDGLIVVCSGGCFVAGNVPDGGGGTGGVGGSAGAAGAAGSAGSAGSTAGAAGSGCTGCVSGIFVCGQCPEACGCCPCTLGDVQDIGGVAHQCDGTCYNPI